jgi:hypothetical protein
MHDASGIIAGMPDGSNPRGPPIAASDPAAGLAWLRSGWLRLISLLFSP